MIGKCPKCEATPNIVIQTLRARDEGSQRTLPVLQFLCDQCKTILSIALDPEWQAQVVAGQLRTVGQGPATSHSSLSTCVGRRQNLHNRIIS